MEARSSSADSHLSRASTYGNGLSTLDADDAFEIGHYAIDDTDSSLPASLAALSLPHLTLVLDAMREELPVHIYETIHQLIEQARAHATRKPCCAPRGGIQV